MPVNLVEPAALGAVAGVRVGTASLGLRTQARDDLALIALAPGTVSGGVFTSSGFAAAPVQVCREHLRGASPRVLVINAGNANAATGERGLADARATCAAAADLAGVSEQAVLPFSTGVIGEHLPMAAIRAALPVASAALAGDAWLAAARAIMTTDTVAKGASRQVTGEGGAVFNVTGIAKGVGMICPDMATMLAFVATDAALDQGAVDALVRDVVGRTFNCITVDGDTSTNDSFVLAATGVAGAPTDADAQALRTAIAEVCTELAHAIVRDGEGATKFVTIRCEGAASEAEARQVGYTIAHSPLVKTALFASDANWGRLVMAVGRAGVEGLEAAGVDLWLDDVRVVDSGGRAASYTEEAGSAVFARDEFCIRVSLGRGSASAELWTCDFSYDYVKINAEYRS